jgi:hypothetical protein
MTPDNAVQLVRELGERASPTPLHMGHPKVARSGGARVPLVTEPQKGFPQGQAITWFIGPDGKREANAAYAALAVNNIGLVLEALEEAGCVGYPDEGGCRQMLGRRSGGWCKPCAALAAVAKAAKEALL